MGLCDRYMFKVYNRLPVTKAENAIPPALQSSFTAVYEFMRNKIRDKIRYCD